MAKLNEGFKKEMPLYIGNIVRLLKVESSRLATANISGVSRVTAAPRKSEIAAAKRWQTKRRIGHGLIQLPKQ